MLLYPCTTISERKNIRITCHLTIVNCQVWTFLLAVRKRQPANQFGRLVDIDAGAVLVSRVHWTQGGLIQKDDRAKRGNKGKCLRDREDKVQTHIYDCKLSMSPAACFSQPTRLKKSTTTFAFSISFSAFSA